MLLSTLELLKINHNFKGILRPCPVTVSKWKKRPEEIPGNNKTGKKYS